MKRIFLIILLNYLVTLSFAQPRISPGQWKGEITKNGKVWNTELNFYSAENNLQGDFSLPDFGLYYLVFNKVHVHEDSIYCEYMDKEELVTFNGNLKGDEISGMWEGLKLKANFFLKKFSDKAPIITSDKVEFTNGDAKLAGTLVIPAGTGPFPAIILVHGSGNQTRNEDFYRSRAYLFATNGIAVLIYDRRGKGSSTGGGVSMELLADDAIAGVHFLQNHKSIKKDQVGIMGFSQGGYIAPLAARGDCRKFFFNF